MIEHPIFVESGGDHLAAVVTVPEARPRTLAVLLPGGGSPRSHKFRLWTRTARTLADVDIASVRVDYAGLGQSTGSFSNDLRHLPTTQIRSIVGAVGEALDVSTFAVVGNCLGARTGLAMAAAEEGCVGVACVLPRALTAIVVEVGVLDQGPTMARSIRLRSARRAPWIGKVYRRIARTQGQPLKLRFIPELDAAARASPVMLLFLGTDAERRRLERHLVAARLLGAGSAGGLTVEGIPTASRMGGFSLPLDVQEPVVDTVVGWLDGILVHDRGSEREREVHPTDRSSLQA
jgi:pimeloyl-ACP methyl ester carboxylesterase